MNVGGDPCITSTCASASGGIPLDADLGADEERSTDSEDDADRGRPDPPEGRGRRHVPAPDRRVPDPAQQPSPPSPPSPRVLPLVPPSGPPSPPGRPDHHPQVPAARTVSDGDRASTSAEIDDRDFRDYVRARSRALLRTAYLLTGNRADAEDLVQSALAKTYLAWDRIEDRAALDGYVRRAMVNTHISWWRRRRVEEFPTDEIPDQAVADHSVGSDMQESLRRAIGRLPQRMRDAVMLRYYEDMTEAEVAEVLGVSLGTVKSTVSRAVAKLRIDADLQPE